MSVTDKLASLGLTLPQAAAPAANYKTYRRHGDLLFISGQLPIDAGRLAVTGKLGGALAVADGQKAARLCAINILAQISAALDGDWDRLGTLVKITGFVACDPSFTEQHLVINGASDFLVEILGERGTHSRSAVGVPSLPLNAAVEIEAIVAIG
ncbi:enamine deaminase RidA (YjgF/YER057c/UK114 family) [Rhodopseudomonas julia]|uniref:Enamine deaminase RidA (YjgF/YER057c/UK114 family) n=1 Tax=Rhodopseudomonas julia TaxID=200617 RepID=A0ABU0CDW4_9BRAD|nr:RidA family protein [Rhodopseudomonas julia]MDQ0327262.1 enamine deaminase RidA (YjgF/YER057c/UK114 family) [Rhodopseudomonas julia]